MNLLAIVGSPRKGKATDMLVDKAIDGVKSMSRHCLVKKINLIEQDIKYCRNCLLDADCLILGTPVHMGFATALMTAFLERICWTFAKPEGKVLTISGCPTPRSDKKRKAAIIVASGIIPPMFRKLCDDAAPLMRQTLKDSLNAKTVGDLYAGDIEHRGVAHYLEKAFNLGRKLV